MRAPKSVSVGALAAPVLIITGGVPRPQGPLPADVEWMHAAWIEAVMLHMTLWTRPVNGTSSVVLPRRPPVGVTGPFRWWA